MIVKLPDLMHPGSFVTVSSRVRMCTCASKVRHSAPLFVVSVVISLNARPGRQTHSHFPTTATHILNILAFEQIIDSIH